MLVLSRKVGEVVTIGSSVKVTILSFDRGIVRLGIEAPKSIPVHRKEVYDKIIEVNKLASKVEMATLKNALMKTGMPISKVKSTNSAIKLPSVNSIRVKKNK